MLNQQVSQISDVGKVFKNCRERLFRGRCSRMLKASSLMLRGDFFLLLKGKVFENCRERLFRGRCSRMLKASSIMLRGDFFVAKGQSFLKLS